MSGAIRYRGNSADLDVYAFGRDEAPLVGEVKAGASGEGFATLERWLGENDALFPRRDRTEPMVVLPWRVWSRFLAALAGKASPWPQAHVPAASASDTEISVPVSPLPPTRLSWSMTAKSSVSRSVDRGALGEAELDVPRSVALAGELIATARAKMTQRDDDA